MIEWEKSVKSRAGDISTYGIVQTDRCEGSFRKYYKDTPRFYVVIKDPVEFRKGGSSPFEGKAIYILDATPICGDSRYNILCKLQGERVNDQSGTFDQCEAERLASLFLEWMEVDGLIRDLRH